ncbi:hypothetical protein TKK_0018701 [Trichogramma kaykai]|uniref:Reverse transcriptase zinc-binding domain-containing protein n=1 Tax=Trichogramma kaykai TaxID=54128 RepID=A0ABD2VY67_9HYME
MQKTHYDRHHIVTINRLRANHYSLGESLHRKNIINTPTCPCGAEIQDIHHITFECPLYTKERSSLLAKLKNYTNINKLPNIESITEILKLPNNPPSKFLTEFLKKTKLQV